MILAVEDAYSKLVVLPYVEVGISFVAFLFRLDTDWCCMAIAWSQFFSEFVVVVWEVTMAKTLEGL